MVSLWILLFNSRVIVKQCVGYDVFTSLGNTSSERAMNYRTFIRALPRHLTRRPREDLGVFFFWGAYPAILDCTRYKSAHDGMSLVYFLPCAFDERSLGEILQFCGQPT